MPSRTVTTRTPSVLSAASLALAGLAAGLAVAAFAGSFRPQPTAAVAGGRGTESVHAVQNADTQHAPEVGQPRQAAHARDVTTVEPADLTGSTARAAEPIARPVAIRIPSIETSASVARIGLQEDGAMEQPDFGVAGWYVHGPRPGQPGIGVIAGHVDSQAGPDVFARLTDLRPKARIHVRRADGSEAVFAVDRVVRQPKEALRSSPLWEPTSKVRVALITCGGPFDSERRSYRDNIIVYATAVRT